MKKGFRVVVRYSVLALALPLGTAHLAGCDAFDKTTDVEHVAKAKDFKLKGNLQGSVIELKNALEKNPDNAEARTLLGQLNLLAGNGAAAEKELRRAVELGVARDAILVPLAEALLQQGKNKELVGEIEVPDEAMDIGDRIKLRVYRGDAWLKQDKPDQAKTEYEEALALDGNSALAKLGLARIAMITGNIDQALRLTKEGLETGPDQAALWSLQAEIFQAKRQVDQAETSYGKAIELRTANWMDRANRALLRAEIGKYEEAAKDVAVLKAEAPKLYMTHHAEGVLLVSQGKYAEAEAALSEALKINPRHTASYYYLALAQLMLNHLVQADSAITRYAAAAPGQAKAHQLLAVIKYREKDYAAAKVALEPVVRQFPEDDFSLRLMAAIDFSMGNREQGLAHLKKVTELEPKSASAEMRLGLGLLSSGQSKQGTDALAKAAELDPELMQAEVYLLMQYMRTKDFAKAEEVLGKLRQKRPNDALPSSLAGSLHMVQGDFDRARKEFREALEKEPGDPTAAHNMATLALQEGRKDEAREYFQQVLEKHPDHLSTLLKVAELDALEGKDFEESLNRIIAKYPDAEEPRLLLARYLTRYGQARKALAVLDPLRAKSEGRQNTLVALVEAEIGSGENARALKTAQGLVKTAPDSALAQYYLARAQGENQDEKASISALERSLQLDPKFLPSRLAMAKWHIQRGEEALAEKSLAALSTDYPEHAEVMSLKASYALQRGRMDEAVKNYRAAFEKYPSTVFATSLARTQWQAGQKREALDLLEGWNRQHPKDIQVMILRASLYSESERLDEAKAQLRNVLQIAPNQVVALNDLAWMLRKDNPAEAQEYAEKALRIAPTVPMIKDTLGVILIDRGESKRAVDLLEQASRQMPNNPSIQYHLAAALEKDGKPEKALGLLKEVLAKQKAFPDRADAVSLMERLSSH